MCTVNEDPTANETDLAPGPGRGPVFPGSTPWKKRGGEHIPRLQLFMQPNLRVH